MNIRSLLMRSLSSLGIEWKPLILMILSISLAYLLMIYRMLMS